jgi:hypothetical protein
LIFYRTEEPLPNKFSPLPNKSTSQPIQLQI